MAPVLPLKPAETRTAPVNDLTRAIGAWTAYWQTGRAGSCFGGADVELQLNKLWDAFAESLASGTTLLDLATGNGTVARICAARARARGVALRIEAVDAARIDPPKTTADPARLFDDIRFHGEVRLEALPFATASIDAIVSQFGFEYADEEQAIAEVARVAAPAARLRFVAHASDGAVARDVGARLERLRVVLRERGPVTLVRTLCRAADTGDAATVARESVHLPAAAALLRELAAHAPPDDAAVFYGQTFLNEWAARARYRSSDLRRSIEQGWDNADGVAARQQQMLQVARSFENINALAGRLTARGFEVEPPRALRDDRRALQIAWLVDARKVQRPAS